MKEAQESRGLILFSRAHREKDKLVKIFTESYGKQMFFVKNAQRKNNPLTAAILPFTEAIYMGNIRSEGLSFLNSAKGVTHFQQLQLDIHLNAYGTYILNLVDAALEDRQYDPALYGFARDSLNMLNNGLDPEIITNIFELQILQCFGLAFNWQSCGVCGKTQGKFDFSTKYQGVLCEQHWEMDPRRYHFSPRAVHFGRLFQQIQYDQIHSIKLGHETKKEIRQMIDRLYEDYVGIHLKSKSFIDQMYSWEEKWQIPPRKPETPEPKE